MLNKIKKSLKKHLSKRTVLSLPLETPNNWHENFIVHLASVLKPKVYVELGLYQCELFNRIIPFSDKLIGVDFQEAAGSFMKKSSKTQFVFSKTEDFIHKAKADSLEIDMLFIDANHSYESVNQDFKNFFPLVKDNGIILLHDGYPRDIASTDSGYCGDGYRAIKELTETQNGFEMMTLPLHPGLTIVRKRKKHLPWL